MELNVLSIENMLPEGRTLEFKESLFSFKPILKTLVAFANTAERTLRTDLLRMKEKGIIKMVGKGPSSQWELIITTNSV